jgi:hypothetical protein
VAVRAIQHRALDPLRRLLLGESVDRLLADPATGDPASNELPAAERSDIPVDDLALDGHRQ